MLAVKELVTNYGASAVFCTATQPALNKRLPKVNFIELAPDPQDLFDFYKRVQITNIGRTPDSDLIEKIKAYPQALCIVNTRKHAKGLFDELKDDEGSFHLSTLMCPTHRKQVLEEVRARLKSGQPCRVISTQVMEAGIDVDFPVGFRALAGLDSIIQAAGRVNRERGNPNGGDMFIFEPESVFIKKIPPYIQLCLGVTRIILDDDRYKNDPTTIASIKAYFNRLYNSDLQDEKAFDSEEILSYFKIFDRKAKNKDDIYNFAFKTVAEKFKIIKANTIAVIIPYDNIAINAIKELRNSLYPSMDTIRRLQLYTVNIYEDEFEALQNTGAISPPIAETYFVLNESKKEEYYCSETGLVIPENTGGKAFFE
jgi:CRISPR-associated endonuclease/helicase Cas3